MEDQSTLGRVVVCSALSVLGRDTIICGPRHFDATMRKQLELLQLTFSDLKEEPVIVQGFIDQFGVFMSREEAWIVAQSAGQIKHRVGGDGTKLFSENLY